MLGLVVPAGASAAPKVLVVGDSLQESTSLYLDKYLPGIELTVNAVGGSNTFEILELFEESYDPSMSVIVFDGGTNDNPNYPEILEENLAKVAATVGNRCMVVPTIHGYTVEGANNRGKNRVVHEFAASRPGTQTPDWATVANTRLDMLQPDKLHPSEEGADYRAQLIAEGILNCLNFAETTAAPVPKFPRRRPPRRSSRRRSSRSAGWRGAKRSCSVRSASRRCSGSRRWRRCSRSWAAAEPLAPPAALRLTAAAVTLPGRVIPATPLRPDRGGAPPLAGALARGGGRPRWSR